MFKVTFWGIKLFLRKEFFKKLRLDGCFRFLFRETFRTIYRNFSSRVVKKSFQRVQKNILRKIFCFCPKNFVLYFFQASSNFFLLFLKKKFQQDCQNCILRVRIDIFRIFKKREVELIISFREAGQKFFDYSEKKREFVITTSTDVYFEKKLFLDIIFNNYFRSLNAFF